MVKIPQRVYDGIFWLSLGLIGLWAVLKAYGIINTPVWQLLLPYVGGIFAAGVFYQMLHSMKEDIRGIKGKIGHMDRDIGHLRIDVEVLKSDMGTVKNKLSL